MSISTDFGANLYKYRKKMNVSRRELSKRANVGHDIIVNYESGKSGIKLDYAERLAEALGIGIEDLLTIEFKETEQEASFITIRKMVREMYATASNNAGRKMVTDMLTAIIKYEDDYRREHTAVRK